MYWRKSWARNWSEVRYCSDSCRRHKVTDFDRSLEQTIVRLLSERSGSLCPSDVARAVDLNNWRSQLEAVRRAARRLVVAGDVVITQGGRVVDPSTAKGPIRIERVQ